MKEYKPKLLEFHKHFKGYERSIGINIARERYNLIEDHYISVHLWWFGVTLVFFRLNKKATLGMNVPICRKHYFGPIEGVCEVCGAFNPKK